MQDLPDVVADPHAEALGLWAGVDDPVTGASFRTVAAPFAVPIADVAVRGPLPRSASTPGPCWRRPVSTPAPSTSLGRGVIR